MRAAASGGQGALAGAGQGGQPGAAQSEPRGIARLGGSALDPGGSQPGSQGAGMGGPGVSAGSPGVGEQEPGLEPGYQSHVQGQQQAGGAQHMTTPVRDAPDANPARSAYVGTAPPSGATLESALERDNIPAPHRERVRTYFDSINPR